MRHNNIKSKEHEQEKQLQGHDKLRSMLNRKPRPVEQDMFKKILMDSKVNTENNFVDQLQSKFDVSEAECRAMYRGCMYLHEQMQLAEWKALNKLQDNIEAVREKSQIKEQW